MKQLIILFFLTLILAQHSFSQSEFLQRGRSGFGGRAGFSVSSEANALHSYVGFSYHGFLDVGLSYSKADGGRVTEGVLSPIITYFPIKQEDAKTAPTLGISLGFSRYTAKTTTQMEVPDTVGIGWRWYRRDTTMTHNVVALGISAQRRIGYWKVFFFQPILGAGVSMLSTGWEFTLHGGVSIGTRIKKGPLLIITPIIIRQSDLTTLVLTCGLVF